MPVCPSGAKFEDVTERVGEVMGNGHGGSILVQGDTPPKDGGGLSEWGNSRCSSTGRY